MSLRFWWKYTLPRLLRFRPAPFEVALGIGLLLFLGLLGSIVWQKLPSSSLGRYESSVAAKIRSADHFPERRADLPDGSRFYRGMYGSTLVLYTPSTPEKARAMLDGQMLTMESAAQVLRELEAYAYRVTPEGFDLEREGAVWGRVSAPPETGQVWCDPSTGEILYFARSDEP